MKTNETRQNKRNTNQNKKEKMEGGNETPMETQIETNMRECNLKQTLTQKQPQNNNNNNNKRKHKQITK